MAKVVGPWDERYPVNFVSHGDTVRAAFGKHIQEIERIYGLLSGLGAAKIEADDLATAITAERTAREAADTTLQSNITAEATARANADATLQNNLTAEATARANADTTEATTRKAADDALGKRIDDLTFANIGGSLGLDRTTGDLPSSRVSGNFGTDRIDGLNALISSSAGGTLEIHDNEDSGYIRFSNGFIVQWADTESVNGSYHITYPIPFPNKVLGGTVGHPKDNYSKTEYHAGGTSSKVRYIFFGY